MLKTVGKTLLCLGGFISSSAFATTHMLAAGMSLSYELPVNVPQVFVNPLLWSIKATCVVNEADENHDLDVSGLSRNSTINGSPLTQGQVITLCIRTGDAIQIYAPPAAKVELTNRGSSVIKARCSTA